MNQWLRDGIPYMQIIAFLAARNFEGINEQNLTNWKDGGHQDWLREQERLADMANKREFAMQIVRENEGSKLHEATLHLAASQIYEALSEFDLSALKDLLAEKPENYAQIVNGIAKLSQRALDVQKYKDANARALKVLEDAKRGADKGGLSTETIERIERELKLL